MLQAKYPGQWGGEKLVKLVADQKSCDAVLAGKTLDEVKATYREELEAFREIRAKYLLYR